MTRKRFIKMLMSERLSKRAAVYWANTLQPGESYTLLYIFWSYRNMRLQALAEKWKTQDEEKVDEEAALLRWNNCFEFTIDPAPVEVAESPIFKMLQKDAEEFLSEIESLVERKRNEKGALGG